MTCRTHTALHMYIYTTKHDNFKSACNFANVHDTALASASSPGSRLKIEKADVIIHSIVIALPAMSANSLAGSDDLMSVAREGQSWITTLPMSICVRPKTTPRFRAVIRF